MADTNKGAALLLNDAGNIDRARTTDGSIFRIESTLSMEAAEEAKTAAANCNLSGPPIWLSWPKGKRPNWLSAKLLTFMPTARLRLRTNFRKKWRRTKFPLLSTMPKAVTPR